jgi:hypothetical protein
VHVHRWHDLSQVVSVSLGEPNLTGLSVKGAFPCVGFGNVLLLHLTDANGSTGTKGVFLLDCGLLPEGDEATDAIAGSPKTESHRRADEPVEMGQAITTPTDQQQQSPSTEGTLFSLSQLGSVVERIAHVVGVSHHPPTKSGRLVFLDTRSWVCSVDLARLEEGGPNNTTTTTTTSRGDITSYTRHFFMPYNWFAGTPCPVGGVTGRGEVVFAKNGEVAVITGGFEYAEVVEVSPLLDSACGGKAVHLIR